MFLMSCFHLQWHFKADLLRSVRSVAGLSEQLHMAVIISLYQRRGGGQGHAG